jgi:hypothetical protein
MERLFAVILLAIVSALEVVLLLNRFIIPAEVMLIFVILLFGLVAVLNQRRIVFWMLIMLLFIADIFNIGYLWLRLGRGIILYLCLMLSCVGLGLAIMNLGSRTNRRVSKATPRIAESYSARANRDRNYEPMPIEEILPVKKEFSPGKYVASKSGKMYHKPRCDWAKKISRKNLVWFGSEKEAEKEGYSRHWCLKK